MGEYTYTSFLADEVARYLLWCQIHWLSFFVEPWLDGVIASSGTVLFLVAAGSSLHLCIERLINFAWAK